ncbi:rod shape-determining protein MreD [Arenibacter sp. 6A1]|nr:rod shape-determining protein MreD [Arenibacter sp. 6A1]
MTSNSYLINTTRFILLILVQVLVFNRLNFFGYINPMVYILFLYWYPLTQNRSLFIFISFLLGLMVDIFSDTMAIHAASTVTLAYLRPTIMRFCFGVNFELQNFKLTNTNRAQRITCLALMIVIHHFVFFNLEIFSYENVLLILKKVSSISLATLIMSLLLGSLFSVKKE